MFFLDTVQAPITIALDKDKIVTVNRMVLGQIVDWASEIMNQQYEEALDGIDDDWRRRQFRAMYPPLQPDLGEMRKRARTPEGVHRIMLTTLVGARVSDGTVLSEEEVRFLIAVNPSCRLEEMSLALSGLSEPPRPDPNRTAEGNGSDPLRRTSSKGSRLSPSTGANSSPPLVPPIQESHPLNSPATFSSPSSITPVEPIVS